MVYLDHNAATPMLPQVIEAMAKGSREVFGNPSSPHTLGRMARAILEEAHEILATEFLVSPHEVIFTSGGTESDHLALRGVITAWNLEHRENPPAHRTTRELPYLGVSAIEHPAVLEAARQLAKENLAETVILKVDSQGILDAPAVMENLSRLNPSRPVLLSLMTANNETGVVQPLIEISEKLKARGALIHTDAVQALGKLGNLGATLEKVSLIALSAHKIGGPKGVGALIVRKGTPFAPTLVGGPQERNRRAGTENIVGILGFTEALKFWKSEGERLRTAMKISRDTLQDLLLTSLTGVSINSQSVSRLPNTLHLTLHGCRSDLLVMALDLQGYCVSAGSACASGSMKPSHVALAMGQSESDAACVLRISLSGMESPKEWPNFVQTLTSCVHQIRNT